MAMIKGNDMDTHQTEAMIDAFHEAKMIWEQTPALHEQRILQGNGGEALQVQQPGLEQLVTFVRMIKGSP